MKTFFRDTHVKTRSLESITINFNLFIVKQLIKEVLTFTQELIHLQDHEEGFMNIPPLLFYNKVIYNSYIKVQCPLNDELQRCG